MFGSELSRNFSATPGDTTAIIRPLSSRMAGWKLLGDLVSEESREFVLRIEVLPLPLLPGGKLPASLEGEELLGLEFIWTEIEETKIKSCQSTHLVRIQGTQNTKEVILNQEVIAVLANQIAGKATREASEKIREGDFDEAARSIRTAAAAVQNLAAPGLTEDAQNLLDETLCKLVANDVTARDLKNMVYESSIRTRPSNRTLNTGSRKKAKPTDKEK